MPDDVREGRMDLRALLAAVEAAAPVDAVDVLATELARMVDASAVSLLIVNFSGDAVNRMSHVVAPAALLAGSNERTESFPLAGSQYERVLLSQETTVLTVEGGCDVLVPVTERGDAMGVLELRVARCPDDDELAYLGAAAHALAYVLIATRRHTDVYEWAQRDEVFSLAAEIQRRLLPSSYTIEAGTFTLAGWLEPAATIGGDTFDYSLDREYLYLSITDAMGHSVDAALLATLTVGSLRNTRRGLSSPVGQADVVNTALLEETRADQFVTGILARVRLADGRVELVNAGHPSPYRLRDGHGDVLDFDPDPVFGVTAAAYQARIFDLAPGDRLLFVTDGFLERNAVDVDIPAVLEENAERHPREIVRELGSHVLRATNGNLRDDATVLCLDWYGHGPRREAEDGASVSRATTA